MLDEERASRRHIHGIGRTLETGAGWIRAEQLCEVSASASLVEKGQRDHALVERPGQQFVVVSLHHDEEQRHVAAAAGSVAVEVDPSTHLVAGVRRVERL